MLLFSICRGKSGRLAIIFRKSDFLSTLILEYRFYQKFEKDRHFRGILHD